MKYLNQKTNSFILGLLAILVAQPTLIPIKVFAFEKISITDITQDEFEKKIREGKALIDKEKWNEAAKLFQDLTNKYPAHKSVDSALYWLAVCYKKNGKFQESGQTIDRLLKNFPESPWTSDAKVLQVEVKRLIGNYDELSKSYQKLSEDLKKSAEELPKPNDYDDSLSNSLAREEEVKLAAFRALLEANPSRAIEIVKTSLENPQLSDTLKRGILRQLQNIEFPASNKDNPLLFQLRETLIACLQKESKLTIKSEIIFGLASLEDDEAINFLSKLYFSGQDREINKFIIREFGRNSLTSRSAKTRIMIENLKFEKLWQIFQTDKDIELKLFALSNLATPKNWISRPEMLENLYQNYQSETDETIKIQIIKAIASSKEKAAINKIIQIAKSDPNNNMRFEAIRLLKTIKTPETIKALEDLIN